MIFHIQVDRNCALDIDIKLFIQSGRVKCSLYMNFSYKFVCVWCAWCAWCITYKKWCNDDDDDTLFKCRICCHCQRTKKKNTIKNVKTFEMSFREKERRERDKKKKIELICRNQCWIKATDNLILVSHREVLIECLKHVFCVCVFVLMYTDPLKKMRR